MPGSAPLSWNEVTTHSPCQICGHPGWCQLSGDGRWAMCRRSGSSPGFGKGKPKNDGNGAEYWIFDLSGDGTQRIVEPPPPGADRSLAPSQILNQVYRAFLKVLPLEGRHREILDKRGLPSDLASIHGYRTISGHRRTGVVEVIKAGLGAHLPHVPGFQYKNEKWTSHGADGFVFPVNNAMGQIIALRNRPDNCLSGGKYRYFSSRKSGGPSPGSQAHVSHFCSSETGMVRITEGELKADIITHITGILTISVPGVSNWRMALPVIEQLRAKTVRLAFDADARTNPIVGRNLRALALAIAGKGYSVELETWKEEKGKGLDDLLIAGKTPEVLVGDAALVAIEGIAKAFTTASELHPDEPHVEIACLPPPNEPQTDSPGEQDSWPDPLPKEAFQGIAGEFVEALAPHTEADPAALLTTFLICLGNLIGDGPHYIAEDDKHPARLFMVAVGDSSKGRKGVSRGRVLRILQALDPQWHKNIKSGLVSGEGLVYHVRDPREEVAPIKENGRVVAHETVMVDSGIEDKRLLVFEDEFSNALKVMKREGNTLSPVIRSAWDRGDLSTLAKNSPTFSTGAHVSIIGHITRMELVRHLDETECANGFGNRFLWVCVRRSQILPFGGKPPQARLAQIHEKIRCAVHSSKSCGEVGMNQEAAEYWTLIYRELSNARPGLSGSLAARGEAQVVRLALLYALLDSSKEIQKQHLEASMAVWVYSVASVLYIFGEKTGDPVADKVLKALQGPADGLSLSQLHRTFNNHLKGERLREALLLLERSGLVRHHVVTCGEYQSELRWFAKI
jgi:uncharacterized protein DUF3854